MHTKLTKESKMLTLEQLKKDLASHEAEQAKVKEAFFNLSGAIQLARLQIQRIEKAEAEKENQPEE